MTSLTSCVVTKLALKVDLYNPAGNQKQEQNGSGNLEKGHNYIYITKYQSRSINLCDENHHCLALVLI